MDVIFNSDEKRFLERVSTSERGNLSSQMKTFAKYIGLEETEILLKTLNQKFVNTPKEMIEKLTNEKKIQN